MRALVGLAVFGSETRLFKRFNYWNRIVEGRSAPPEPITDIKEALVLLYEGLNDRTQRYVNTIAELPNGTRGPAVRIGIYSSGYTKEEFSCEYCFQLDSRVFEELKSNDLLSGTPRLGYTDDTKLHLNERGMYRLLIEVNHYVDEPLVDTKAE